MACKLNPTRNKIPINVLILDDIELVADNIRRRICKANQSNSDHSIYEIEPHYLRIDQHNITESTAKIISKIKANNIEVLLLDRGFYDIIDPEQDDTFGSLDKSYLYGKWEDFGVKIEEILAHVQKDELINIKGVIIYSYDTDIKSSEPAEIKNTFKRLLPANFDKDNIDVILTNTEIYNLADRQLYIVERNIDNPDLLLLAAKSDLILYGLFIGEILYHRTVSLMQKRRQKIIVTYKARTQTKIFILFGIFTTLNLGANALYSLLSKSTSNTYLVILALGFALFLPLLLLSLKPELIIDMTE